MKDIIIDRLNKMEDLEQRKLLKNIMAGFFANLIDYQETMNKNLESRVFNEVEDEEAKYDIFVNVCHKNEIDPTDTFLYPVFPSDAEEKECDIKDIIEKLNRKEEIRLFNVFMKCSYPQIRELIESKKEYKGEIRTDKTVHEIRIRLELDKRYMDEVEKLYKLFVKNDVPWRTVNNPYANRFFNVILTGCSGYLDEEEEVSEIVFNLEEYDQYKMLDMVLLWNVERLSLKSDGFPMPAIDRVNFEHSIFLKKYGLENGYIVDGDDYFIRYIKRTQDELTIISPEEKVGVWNILKITRQNEDNIRKRSFELVSNRRKVRFTNKFANKQSSIIRTKAEIFRIVESFDVSEYFDLQDVSIMNSVYQSSETYDLNSFILDDIRVGNDRKIMKLQFKSNNYNSFISYDLLSFIVSEVQMYFPEYECVGELA